jgi:hypothetical protein
LQNDLPSAWCSQGGTGFLDRAKLEKFEQHASIGFLRALSMELREHPDAYERTFMPEGKRFT